MSERLTTKCGTCGKVIRFPPQLAGQAAACPQCGEQLRLVDRDAPMRPPVPVVAAPEPVPAPQPIPAKPKAAKKTIEVPAWTKPAAVGLVIFVLGYFAGREHLKYQVKCAIESAGQAFMGGLGQWAEQADRDSGERGVQKMRELIAEDSFIASGNPVQGQDLHLVMTPDWHLLERRLKDQYHFVLNAMWREAHPGDPGAEPVKVVIQGHP